MYIVMFRTFILYFVVVIIMRLMGKRQIGEMQPFELVITIMISELASLPMQDTRIPLLHGIIPIVTLLVLQVILSILQLKIEKARVILSGKPSILIKDGKIDIKELKNQRITINDLIEDLRLLGTYNLDEIEYAILETSGQLSVIPKTELTPVTKKDMNIKCNQDKLPITLILDGKINEHNLEMINKDKNWLNKKLKESKITSISEVFVAILDSKDTFYCQPKEGVSNKK